MALESHRKRGRQEIDRITQTKRALETNPAETDRMQRALVGITKPAQRSEMLFGKILAIVGEDKAMVLDPHRRFGCAGVVRILQQLRQNMARTLDLLEELMPRSGEFGIAFQLVPTLALHARVLPRSNVAAQSSGRLRAAQSARQSRS